MKGKQNPVRPMVWEFTKRYLLISLIPVVLIFLFAILGAYFAQQHLSQLLNKSTHELNSTAKKELETLGQQIIQINARQAARQVAVFLSFQPDMDIHALQQSDLFQAIAMQKVGKSGYVCLYEANTGIMRIHPNPQLINRKMAFLSETIPSWWEIFKDSLSWKEISGYYDWIDPDGSVRKKYMTMTPVETPLGEKRLMVAATTYIDEFMAPVTEIDHKAFGIRGMFEQFLSRQIWIAGCIIVFFLLGTVSSVYLIGRRSALYYMLPIVSMAKTAEKLGDGEWETTIQHDFLDRKDEVGVLARSFESMQRQLQRLFQDIKSRVSDLKAAQNSLKESERHFRSLFDGVPVGLYRSTLDGNILDANPALIRMLGYPSKKEFLSRKAGDMYAKRADRSKWKMIIEGSGIKNVFEVEMCRYDQSVIWVENHSRTVRGADRNILYIEGSLINVTDRKKMEAQLQFAQRMEAIGTLAGGIAHDFNNLMMGILGNISIMKLDTAETHPHYEKIQKVEKLVHSGSKLTSQLLGYARKGQFELKVVDLNKVVRDSLEIFARTRKEVALKMQLDASKVPVAVDRSQIEQVLFNLCINAADAMQDGGDLLFSTSVVHAQDITDRPYQLASGRYAKLQVSDTGHGMDLKTQSRIFDPFFTTKEMGRGTGLGLASSYGIVKAHGGYIDVMSKVGCGTTFTILLPISKHETIRSSPSDTPIKFGEGTILVVDDEELVLEIGVEMIKKMGYQTLSASSGDKAISLFSQHSDEIDMVILDLIMPGTSGSDTFDRVRQINPDVKIILSSGYSIDKQANELIDRGCNGFIQKPYSLEDLSQKIDEILKQ